MERMITPDSRAKQTVVAPSSLWDAIPDPADDIPASLDPEAAIAGILAATRELTSRLQSYERVLVFANDLVRTGARISEVVEALPPDDRRTGAEVAMTEFFESRRTLRRALVAGLLIDGLSVDEIAATFRVPVEGICAFAAEVAHLVD